MIIFYDLETTGLNQYHDKITEICMIKFNYFTNQTETFNTLINPEKKFHKLLLILLELTKAWFKINQLLNK